MEYLKAWALNVLLPSILVFLLVYGLQKSMDHSRAKRHHLNQTQNSGN